MSKPPGDWLSRLDQHAALMREPWRWRGALARSRLPASALRVGIYLVDDCLNRTDGDLYPGYDRIASGCNLPVDTVKDGIRALKAVGLLKSKRRFGTSNLYFLALPDPVKIHPTVRWKSTRRSGENPPTNLRREPEKGTREDPDRAHQSAAGRSAGPPGNPPYGRIAASCSSEPATEIDDREGKENAA